MLMTHQCYIEFSSAQDPICIKTSPSVYLTDYHLEFRPSPNPNLTQLLTPAPSSSDTNPRAGRPAARLTHVLPPSIILS